MSLPAVQRAPAALSGTSMAFVVPKGPALPFQQQEREPDPSAPIAGPIEPTDAPAKTTDPAENARAPSPSGTPTLTLEQYASLCAELAVFPQQQDAVFQRYGLGDQRDRTAVGAEWQNRLKSNAEEYRRWQTLYQQYHAHVAGSAQRRS